MFIFSTHNEHFRVARWPVTGGRVIASCYHQLAGWPPGHRPPVLRPVGSEIVPSSHPPPNLAQEVPKSPGRSPVSGTVAPCWAVLRFLGRIVELLRLIFPGQRDGPTVCVSEKELGSHLWL